MGWVWVVRRAPWCWSMRKNRVIVYWVVTDESQSESRLVMSDSLWLHGILQARILEWVGFPFSRWSSQPRDQTQISHNASRFFINRAIREALLLMTDANFLINPTGGPHSQCECDQEDKKESVSIITLPDSHKDTQTHTGSLLTQSLTREDQTKSSNCSVMKINDFILFLHQAQRLIPSLPPGFHIILR